MKMTVPEYQLFMMNFINGLVATSKEATPETWDKMRDDYVSSMKIDPKTHAFLTHPDA